MLQLVYYKVMVWFAQPRGTQFEVQRDCVFILSVYLVILQTTPPTQSSFFHRVIFAN